MERAALLIAERYELPRKVRHVPGRLGWRGEVEVHERHRAPLAEDRVPGGEVIVADYAPWVGICPPVPLDSLGKREPRDGFVVASEQEADLEQRPVGSDVGALAPRGTFPGM